jgi:putative DNA primase/helicase
MGRHADGTKEQNENADQLVLYLQKVLGCAATGKPEKLIFVLFGEGNNGKTTLLEIIRDVLGDKQYAGQVQVDSLMVRPKEALSNNAVNTDLADLQGCRFVSSSEVERGQKLSLSRVKYLTGLSQIKARRMRENMISFQPTHKIFLDCNHKPAITDPNDAIWNRVKCIPFQVAIPESEIDRDLPAKLRTELPGILKWIVEGAVLYHRNGLGDPPAVKAATEKYRQESDQLKEFLEDRCVLEPRERKAEVPISALWQTYETWTRLSGERHPLAKNVLEAQLEKLGCAKGRDTSGNVRVWKGVRLRPTSDNLTTSDSQSHNFFD